MSAAIPAIPADLNLVPLPLEQLPPLPSLRLAVLGHVEVVSFVEVGALPRAGEILRAHHFHEVPAGGGAVVAVQMARLLGAPVPFFTALGRDAVGERAAAQLQDLGLELHVSWQDAPTRRAITFVDGEGERTITVIGERLQVSGSDPLPWERLEGCDAVFVTAGDAAAVRRARGARHLIATPRTGLAVLQQADVQIDALIGSGLDPAERCSPTDLSPPPALLIATEGAAGGSVWPLGHFAAPRRSRPIRDTYGAGDSFAAGVSAGLAAGWGLAAAISLGCHCGSACLDGRGPYPGQLRRRSMGGGLQAPDPDAC